MEFSLPWHQKWPPFGVTTLMMSLLFGSNFVLYLFFQFLRSDGVVSSQVAEGEREDAVEKSDASIAKTTAPAKKLSLPFKGTPRCFKVLTSELFRTGILMSLTYLCEQHWYLPHSSKHYSRDLFLFIVLLFFALAVYTTKPNKDLSLLGRAQTEEWKGWMQFIFLLYHYFHAEEVYNSVRVMITCYVWMTGFGNFSFFYIKRDFSWLRVAQMLWRLNFSVLLLMWTHGNTYILYYICPLHTFYFLMVYVTMYCYQSLNHTKWGIRWKLLAVAVIIYVVWDVNGGLFDILFFWLGTGKVIGAGSGSVWEYYFRTSLDHYSTFFGMIFALNFPLAEQFFIRGRWMPLLLTGIVLGASSVLWLLYVYPLEKLQYNLIHAYTAFIPLTSYIFFRNLTPGTRSYVSMSLHDLGKTTLETYLLQHHIWLTSNAKTLLTIVPGMPWVNFFLASFLFLFCAKELYRLTMSLRGMILPDDKDIAWRNILGTLGVLVMLFLLAFCLSIFNPTLIEIAICSICLGLLVLLLISWMTGNFDNSLQFISLRNWSIVWIIVTIAVLMCMQLFYGIDGPSSNAAHDSILTNTIATATYSPRSTGAMSFPLYGACTIVAAAVMLFSMDSFFGIGFLSMCMCGGRESLNWDDAYDPLLRKIRSSLHEETRSDTVVEKNGASDIELSTAIPRSQR